jgi:sugar-specific transcriptional regulator TrmB
LEVKESEVLIKLGLSPSEARVFASLSAYDVASIKELAKDLNMERANVYRTINRLKERGFVRQL